MPLKICPFGVALFMATAALTVWQERRKMARGDNESGEETLPSCNVVFVIGGPGAGKGTQCQLLVDRNVGWAHLSAGDLLRAERKAGGALGDLINAKIAAGQLVPSSITVKLLENAMGKQIRENQTTNFLIDGFPRNFENLSAWEDAMKNHRVRFVLSFECPEEVLVGRLLERGETSGRSDDKIDVIRKRFRTFQNESIPVLSDLERRGMKIHQIQSDRSVEDIYKHVASLFEGI